MKYLVLGWQGAVGDVRGEVGVIDGAEGQTVRPAAAEIGDVNILHGNKRQPGDEGGMRQPGCWASQARWGENMNEDIKCLGGKLPTTGRLTVISGLFLQTPLDRMNYI